MRHRIVHPYPLPPAVKDVFVKGCLIITLILFGLSAYAQRSIDQKESSVKFEVYNVLSVVKGEFKKAHGEIRFDPEDLSSARFHIELPVHSIVTGNSFRDSHLHKEEFFHTELFPKILFTSNTVTLKSGEYWVEGELSLKGIKRTLSFPFTYKDKTFLGSFSLLRKNYNIGSGYDKIIGSEVRVDVKCKLNDK